MMNEKGRKRAGAILPKPDLIENGDVIGIPLSDGRFAYARQYGDVFLGVLDIVPSPELLHIESIEKIRPKVLLFVQYCEPYDVSPWYYIGHWEFLCNEISSPPPVFIKDVIDPCKYRIVEGGEVRAADKAEIEGLQEQRLLFPESIRERIERLEHFR